MRCHAPVDRLSPALSWFGYLLGLAGAVGVVVPPTQAAASNFGSTAVGNSMARTVPNSCAKKDDEGYRPVSGVGMTFLSPRSRTLRH